jgi:hypothetical protein
VDQHDVDVQAAQHGDVKQQVAEILIGHHRAIDCNEEDPLPELRDVVEDAEKIGRINVLGKLLQTKDIIFLW